MTDAMRKYLVTIVFKPDADVAAAIKEIKESLTGGEVTNEEELALKKLAYEIVGSTEARIYQMQVTSSAGITQQLTQDLNVREGVVRFLIKSVKEEPTKEKAKKE